MKKIIYLLIVLTVIPSLLFSCSKNKYETVMEYNGVELKENMYYYWISTFKKNILAYYSDARDDDSFWQQKYDEERTVEEYFTEIINNKIKNYLIAQSIFRENKLKLSSEVKKTIKDDIKEKIDYYGSRSELNKELQNLMLNINSLEDIYTWEEKHDAVYDYLFGKNGIEAATDKEIEDYYKNNYSRIKYIVFYTTKIKTDEKGEYVYDNEGQLITEEMTKEELEAKKKEIDQCYDKLQNGASFDEMRKKYSEFDSSDYPNGFFVSPNELQTWGPDIIIGASKSKPGEIYKVEEEAAVYIILKCDLTEIADLTETDIKQLANLNVYTTRKLYEEKFSKLYENIKINNDILDKYKLSTVKPNPYYSI